MGDQHIASDADPPSALVDRVCAALAAEPEPDDEPSPPLEAPVQSDGEPRRTLVAVWGPKGAPGRTTIAVNLAFEVTRASGEALLVDADTYGGAIAHANIQEHHRKPATRFNPVGCFGADRLLTPEPLRGDNSGSKAVIRSRYEHVDQLRRTSRARIA